jgi:hypothetical protein
MHDLSWQKKNEWDLRSEEHLIKRKRKSILGMEETQPPGSHPPSSWEETNTNRITLVVETACTINTLGTSIK